MTVEEAMQEHMLPSLKYNKTRGNETKPTLTPLVKATLINLIGSTHDIHNILQ